MAGSHLDPKVVEAFVDLYATHVLTSLEEQMARGHEHEHPDEALAA
jgi:hypothetical protein